MILADLALSGAALAGAYALVALGFVLVIAAAGAVNFAHGDLVAAGGYAALAIALLTPPPAGWPGLALLPAALVAGAALGLLIGLVAYLPLARRPPVSVFVSTIACGIMLQNLLLRGFGPEPRAAPPLLAGVGADGQSVAIVGVSLALLLAVWLWLHRTQPGRRLRAAAQDREAAQALGIAVRHQALIAFAAAGALAAVAGLLLGNRYFVAPEDGAVLILKAYVAVTIGGWGRVEGALLGAALIALFEVAAAALVSQPVAEALLYAVLLLVLAFRPQGLLGEPAGRRA